MRDRIGDFERLKIVEKASLNLYTKDGQEALDYLVSQRLISLGALKDFRVGYVPENLYFENTKHELAGRIIYPICDSYGEIVAVSSRDFRNISSSNRGFWHESFSKSHYLFGLDIAKQYILSKNRAILIEGETDELRMHTFNFKETVAILGSALSMYHLSLLSRYTSNIYLLFDGDDAGDKSIEKALKVYKDRNLKNYDFRFIPVKLPRKNNEKIDPDEFLKTHSEKDMEELLQESLDKFENYI